MYVVSGPTRTFKGWLIAIAAAAGHGVRTTPRLPDLGRWTAHAMARLDPTRIPAITATLDYQLRPRAHRLARSIVDLGADHDDELEPHAAAAVAQYESIARA